MKKLYQKDAIWFAVLWIILYVVCFSNADTLSKAIGVPKLLTVLVGAVLSIILWRFIRKNQLSAFFGLCKGSGNGRELLWYIPLIVITSVNFWNGVTCNYPIGETVLYIISMCFVGFLEEVIFRGLLFKGMCKNNAVSAIIVSSLTFGVGHIVNLLQGGPVLDTLLQLMYASAVGFCYTAVFYVGGSIWPCILSHAVVNSLSAFAVEPTEEKRILIAAIQTALGVGYGLWLLRNHMKKKKI